MIPRIQVVLFSVLLLLLPQIGAAAADPKDLTPKQKEAIEAMGPIVDPAKYPNLESYLRGLADKILPYQVQLLNSRAEKERVEHAVNEIYFVDSDNPNAFVLTGKGMLVKGILTNRIVISTGLIKFLHDRVKGDPDLYSFYLLGALAHEMAHPVEYSQVPSLSRGWQSGQAGEVLADYDAAHLLREAGFPENATYEVTKVLLQSEVSSDSTELKTDTAVLKKTAEAVRASHPETGLRLSLQRIGLTLGRRLYGTKEQVSFLAETKKLQEEVKQIASSKIEENKVDLKLKKLPLGTLEEVQSAIDEYITKDKTNSLQFNHLLLILGERVAAQKGAPDPAFVTWMTNLLTEILDNEHLDVRYNQFPDVRRSMMRVSFLRPEQKAFEDEHPKRFAELLSKSEWLNHPSFIKHFRTEFLKIYGNNILDMPIEKPTKHSGQGHLFFTSHGLNQKVQAILSPDLWFKVLEKEWVEAYEVLIKSFVENRGKGSTESFGASAQKPLKNVDTVKASLRMMLGGISPEYRTGLLEVLQRQSGDSEELFFEMMLAQNDSSTLDPFLVSRLDFSKAKQREMVRVFAKEHPGSIDRYLSLHDKYHDMLLFADVFLSLELRSDYREHYTDWEMLSELRGEKKFNSKKLGREFAKFSKSREYAAWIERSIPSLTRKKGKNDFDHNFEENLLDKLKSKYIDFVFRPKWWSSDLTEALLGESNPLVKKNLALKEKWQSLVKPALAVLDPVAFGRISKEELSEKFAQGVHPDFKFWVSQIYSFAWKEIEPSFETEYATNQADHLEILRNAVALAAVWYLDVVQKSEMSPTLRKKLLASFGAWSLWLRSPYAIQIWDRLQSMGLSKKPSDFLKKNRLSLVLLEDDWGQKKSSFANRVYRIWGGRLSDELSQIEAYPELEKFVQAVFGLSGELAVSMSPDYARILDESIQAIGKIEMEPEQRIKLYQKITKKGGTLNSDELLLKVLWPAIEQSSLSPRQLGEMAMNARSQRAKLALTRLHFERLGFEKFDNLKSAAGIQRFQKQLDSLVPGRSLERDAFIEELNWSMRVDDLELLREMDEAKSTGSRRSTSPYLVSVVSALNTYFGETTPEERWELIEYFSTSSEQDIPKSVDRHIEKNLGPSKGEELTVGHQINIVHAKFEVHGALRTLKQLSWPEKIPVIEVLLTTGESPLAREALPRDGRFMKVLKLEKGSPIATALEDYIEIIPKHEITVTAAYLLARNSENLDLASGKLKDIFELFQVVGKKIGQGANTWGLVENSEELRDLKDRSSPMSKLEIVSAAHKYFGEKVSDIQGYERILAAGSIKTVTEVKLENGKTAALETRSEYADRQVRATLALAYKYVAKLQSRGLVPAGAFVSNLMSRLAVQLNRELDFTNEATALPVAKKVFDQIQTEMGSEMNGYQISVPQPIEDFPITPRAMMVEFASGEAVDRLTPEQQAEVGPLLLRVYAKALLRLGWIDADRSVANQLVDPDARNISILDLGQATELARKSGGVLASMRADDRTYILNLIAALNDGQPQSMIAAVGPLLTKESMKSWDRSRKAWVLYEVEKQFSAESHIEQRLISLITALENNGLHMEERFSLYALKGMLTLLAEPYADKETQKEILKASADDLVAEKKPYFAMGRLKDSCEQLLSRFQGR